MADAGRRELKAEYKESRPEAGVYRVVNPAADRSYLASSTNLRSARNRFEFARGTRSPAGIHFTLKDTITADEMPGLTFEVLETLPADPAASPRKIAEELATLEQLWREKLGADALY